ncbi:hypothetical protein JCM10213v2_000242 [Rhodosporidiobolus nylandii]
MAPGQSMLPVRCGAAAPSGLPRPTYLPRPVPSTSQHAPPPRQPEPPTPARSIAEVSRFDLGDLLAEQEGDSLALLNDLEAPSFLADQSAFTMEGRTPARSKGKGKMLESLRMSPDLFEGGDEDELMLVSMGGGVSLGFGSGEDSTFTAPQTESLLPSTSLARTEEPRAEAYPAVTAPRLEADEHSAESRPPTPTEELPEREFLQEEEPMPAGAPKEEEPDIDGEPLEEYEVQEEETLSEEQGVDEEAATKVEPEQEMVEGLSEARGEPVDLDEEVSAALHPSQVKVEQPAVQTASSEPSPPPPVKTFPPRYRPSLAPLPHVGPAPPLNDPESPDPAPQVSLSPPPASVAAAELSVVAEVEEEPTLESGAALLPVEHPQEASSAPLDPAPRPALRPLPNAAPLSSSSLANSLPPSLVPPTLVPPASRKPRASAAAALSRSTTALPADRPSQRRRTLGASLPPSAAPLKRSEKAPLKFDDEEEAKRKKVREAKEERERKAAERKAGQATKATEPPPAKKARVSALPALAAVPAHEPVKLVEAQKKGDEKEEDAKKLTLVKEAEDLLAALNAPVDLEQEHSAEGQTPDVSASHIPDDTPPSPALSAPRFAFDGDMTLPAMGAPLDLDNSFGSAGRDGGLGVSLGPGAAGLRRAGVTSTPARPMKRKAVDVEEPAVEEESAEEMLQRQEGVEPREQERKKARRATLAVPLPPLAEKASVEVVSSSTAIDLVPKQEDNLPLPHSVAEPAQPKPRRRPSRVSLAPGEFTLALAGSVSFSLAAPAPPPATAEVEARPVKGKAVRVSLVAPALPQPAGSRKSLSASTSTAKDTLSRSQRRASRVEVPVVEQSQVALAQSTTLSASVALSRSTSNALRTSLVPPADDYTTGPATSLAFATSTSLSHSTRRASRVSLAPPAAGAHVSPRVPEQPVEQPLSSSQRRASRVSLAPPAEVAPVAPVEPGHVQEKVSAEEEALSRSHRRASRVSLAPPPPTPPSRRSVEQQVEAELAALEPPPEMLRLSTSRRASRVPIEAEAEEQVNSAPSAPPAQPPSKAADKPVFSVSTSSHHAPPPNSALNASTSSRAAAKAPAVPPPVSHLTLPGPFTFAAPKSAAEREAERQRRAEERKKREERAEQALQEKKRARQAGGSSWAVKGKTEKKTEKGKERVRPREDEDYGRKEGAKRPKLASSAPPIPVVVPQPASASAVSAPIPDATSSPAPLPAEAAPSRPLSRLSTSLSTSHRRPRRSILDPQTGEQHIVEPAPAASAPVSASASTPSEPVAAAAPAPAPASAAPTPAAALAAAEPTPLTKAALETNTRAAGSRGDLQRRVSRFLEEIGEEAEEPREDDIAPEAPIPVVEAAEPPHAQPAPSESRPASRQQQHEPVRVAAPRPPPPPAPPAPPAPAKKPATVSKPFTFGASRSSRPRVAPPAPASNTTASPMFVERLSTWKEREAKLTASSSAATAGSRVRKALASAAAPPPPAKKARVEAVAPAPAPAPAKRRPEPLAQRDNGKDVRAAAPATTAPVAKRGAAVKVAGGVAEEMERRLKEKLEWSERQKKREEEVKRAREKMREEEAEREREKLKALRASLLVSRAPVQAKAGGAPGRARGAGRM